MDTKERIQAAIRDNPNQLTMLLARQFVVPEVEIVRAFPDDRTVELEAQRWEGLIRSQVEGWRFGVECHEDKADEVRLPGMG